MSERAPRMPSMTSQVQHALRHHDIAVRDGYWTALSMLDGESYLPNSCLMYEINAAMLSEPEVAAQRFERHSRHEASGSRFIEAVARRFVIDSDLRTQLLKHADDEARHCRMFAALAARFEGDASSNGMTHGVDDDEENIESFNGDLANFLISTHTAEVRNLTILSQYIRILASSRSAENDRIRQVLDRVHEDEMRHVAYTAAYVSLELERGAKAHDLFAIYTGNYVRDAWAEVSAISGNLARHTRGQ